MGLAGGRSRVTEASRTDNLPHPLGIANLRGQCLTGTVDPIPAFVVNFHEDSRLAPQVEQLDDAFVTSHKMFAAMLGGVISLAEDRQFPVRAFRATNFPSVLPLLVRQDAPVLQRAEDRGLAAFARSDFQQPAMSAGAALVPSALLSRRAIEKRRRVGIGFSGMKHLADVGAAVFAREPLRAAQKVLDEGEGRAAFHRQRVMNGQAHVFRSSLHAGVGQMPSKHENIWRREKRR